MKSFMLSTILVMLASVAVAGPTVPQGFIDLGFTNLVPVMAADGVTVAYWTGTQPESYSDSNENAVSLFNILDFVALSGK